MADEDLIANQGPPIIARLTLTLFAGPDGKIGGMNLGAEGDFNEIHARFMLSKAMATLEDNWRMANASRVVPAGGLNGIPDIIKRHMRQS